jgi:hypothetical protein
MKKHLTTIAMVLLTAPSWAQEVPDQSTWVGGGETVTVDVDQPPSGTSEVPVTFTDSNGTSSAVNGSPGPGNTVLLPTCDQSPESVTPGADGTKYRVKDGKLQRKTKNGRWVNMRKKSKEKRSNGTYNPTGSATNPDREIGEEVTSLPND